MLHALALRAAPDHDGWGKPHTPIRSTRHCQDCTPTSKHKDSIWRWPAPLTTPSSQIPRSFAVRLADNTGQGPIAHIPAATLIACYECNIHYPLPPAATATGRGPRPAIPGGSAPMPGPCSLTMVGPSSARSSSSRSSSSTYTQAGHHRG